MPYLGHQYYEERGSGPALLLLHGHTLDHRMWEEHVAELAERYRVITPDLEAHGRTGLAPDQSPLCHQIASLLDQLGVEKAAVCGLSMGGAVAVSFGLHHPSRCAALIPVDAALYGYPFTTWPGPGPYVKQANREGLAPALEAWLSDPLFAPAVATPAARRIASIVREYPGTEWLTRRSYLPFPPGPYAEANRLGEIGAPTLVMIGEQDLEDFQRIASHLAESIPDARKAVIPGAGHLLPFEQPVLFREELLRFLSAIPSW